MVPSRRVLDECDLLPVLEGILRQYGASGGPSENALTHSHPAQLARPLERGGSFRVLPASTVGWEPVWKN